MPIIYDLVVAEDWEEVLNAADHRARFPCEQDVGVNVDDLATLLTVARGVAGDREQWREARDQLRVEWHSHPEEMKTRKVFVLDMDALNEIANIAEEHLTDVASQWQAVSPNVQQPLAVIQAIQRTQTLANQASASTFLKTFEASNAFEQSALAIRDQRQRSKYLSVFETWSEQHRLDANRKLLELRRLNVPDQCALAAVLGDINEHEKYATTYAFLGAVRSSVQEVIDGDIAANDDREVAAIARFRTLLTDNEQKRIRCAIAKEVMLAIYNTIEGDDDKTPFRWALVRVDSQTFVEPPLSSELHAYMEDDWVFPNADGEQ